MRALITATLQPFELFNKLWDVDNLENESVSSDDFEREVRHMFRLMHYNLVDVNVEDIEDILHELDSESAKNHEAGVVEVASQRKSHSKLSADDRLVLKQIIGEIPTSLRDAECRRVIALGYSKGQANFIVSAINIDELHIRIKGGLFGNTERACKDIIKKAAEHRQQVKGLRAWLRRMRIQSQNPLPTSYMTLEPKIEVLEPGEKEANNSWTGN